MYAFDVTVGGWQLEQLRAAVPFLEGSMHSESARSQHVKLISLRRNSRILYKRCSEVLKAPAASANPTRMTQSCTPPVLAPLNGEENGRIHYIKSGSSFRPTASLSGSTADKTLAN